MQKGSLLPVPTDDRVSCDSSLWAGELLPGTLQCNKASWMLAEQRNSPAGATARQAAGLCLEHSEQACAQRGVAAGKITRGKPRRSCPTHQAFASIASLKSQLWGVPPSLLPAQLNPAAPGAAFPSVTLGGGTGMSDSLCERRALRSRDAARREELRERRGALLLHCSPLLHANEQ